MSAYERVCAFINPSLRYVQILCFLYMVILHMPMCCSVVPSFLTKTLCVAHRPVSPREYLHMTLFIGTLFAQN